MKRLCVIAALLVPLSLASTQSFALSCGGGRLLIIVNDGSVIGKEVCAGAAETPWPNWLIGWFM